ncbi:Saccharopine dehydrogenase-domain-containing protein [Lentinula aff. lateritia]|uniref:Saccharopine dehydrogenase-domain-containing protein n=1 Tax=Lentinula aff. lateritia TaxID=2804960 RepID=A0ACC1TMF9_9AGAR|nr:Saccharopine dehydrogenase-domain-containing protein [Lentinula aff. lateritia]
MTSPTASLSMFRLSLVARTSRMGTAKPRTRSSMPTGNRHLRCFVHSSTRRINFSRHLATYSPLIIGIRSEDSLRIWERRVPLTPEDVKDILEAARRANERYKDMEFESENRDSPPSKHLHSDSASGLKLKAKASTSNLSRPANDPVDSETPFVPEILPYPLEIHIQPSPKRIFPDSAYVEAGAKVTDDLRGAHVLLGIKEVSVEEVMRDAAEEPGKLLSVKDAKKMKVARTYMMFSHTAKGQEYNMPLLDRFLNSELDLRSQTSFPSAISSESRLPTLIDYELLTSSSSSKRTLAFGFHAGLAGTLLSLYTLGAYFFREFGIQTPWLWTPLPHLPLPNNLNSLDTTRATSSRSREPQLEKSLISDLDTLPVPYPHTLPSTPELDASLPGVDELRRALRDVVGGMIRAKKDGTGEQFGPCVIGVTGSGNVSQGCLSMLSELPHRFVEVHELPDLVLHRKHKGSRIELDLVYVVRIKPEDYLVRKDSLPSSSHSASASLTTFSPSYSRSDYHVSPSSYTSIFPTRIAPYLTLLLNGAGWAPGYPKMMSEEGVKTAGNVIDGMDENTGKGRFAVVGDISCDPYGGLEFVTHATTLSNPFYKTESISSPSNGSSPTFTAQTPPKHPVYVQSVDILPASLPVDASKHFSNGLKKYLWGVVRQYASGVEVVNVASQETREAETRDEIKEVEDALERATIASRGRLAGRFAEEGFLGAKVGAYRAKRDATGVDNLTRPFYGGSKRCLSSLSSSSSSTTSPASSMFSPPSSPLPPLPTSPKHPKHPKRILLLGSGMVAGPAIRWIMQRIMKEKDVVLVIAGKERGELEKLKRLARSIPENAREMVTFRQMDIAEENEVRKMVGDVDVVISLLPAPLHPPLAKLCIAQRTHLVTASYISPEMRSLDRAAQQANVLLLNEIGLDPGIDHVSAISMLEKLKEEGKEVKSFESFCGGLPEPNLLRYPKQAENSMHDVGANLEYPPAGPLSYKFSWSPRGVLTAALNGARYKMGGMIVEVPGTGFSGDGTGILAQENMFPNIDFGECEHDEELRKLQGMLEGLPNRDSLPYAEMYGLPDSTRTVLRGTLRYKGFAELMFHFHQQGFLDVDRTIDPESFSSSLSSFSSESHEESFLTRNHTARALERAWKEVVLQIRARPSSSSSSFSTSSSAKTEDPLANPIAWLLSAETGTPSTTIQQWIGLPLLPSSPTTPLDLFTLLLAHKLQYDDGERDIVVLVHKVITRVATDKPVPNADEIELEELHTSSLVIYGSYHNSTQNERFYESAMARSVGIPVAIAALAVLDGAVESISIPRPVSIRGVHGPGHISIREPVLQGMLEAGIGISEGVTKVLVRDQRMK